MVSHKIYAPFLHKCNYDATSHVSVVTRYFARRLLPRFTHKHGGNRTSLGDNTVYYVRSDIFYIFLLGVLP